MDWDWAAVFDVSADDRDEFFAQFEHATFRGRHYRHLSDARRGVERGTAIIDGAVVRGFPSIPRTLVLDPGIPEFFDGPVTIEEKLNGYNVRIAYVDSGGDDEDGLLAFTRSGYICPYTTEQVRALLDPAGFFDDHRELMLCGELVGPENPYTAHDYREVDSAALYVFDVRHRESGEPLPIDERRALCRAYGFDQVRTFGTHDPGAAVHAARDAIDDLDASEREGIVLKSQDGTRMLKYTTSSIHRQDLEHAFALPFDYGRDFMFPRILREIFQAVEFEDSDEQLRERAHKLGEAILLPAVEAVRDVQAGETVGESHTVRGDPAVIEALLSYFRDMGLGLDIERDERVDGERVVRFVKISEATRDKTEYYLEGGTIDE
jgi:putative ATP-dependent DNA ligase